MAEFTKLGKYEIRRELGRGAMGVVYEAFDPLIERVVALKTIRPDQLAGGNAAEILARFRREAQAAGRLTHPNIVAIYDFGEDAGVWYIAMELVKGRELKEYFEKNERFGTADAVRILAQILAALGYSHRLGVVHRDIKPSNVFLLPDGAVKVADFGIAHVESSELTQVGTVLGTPAYMSPEQILGLPVDGRSDLFSVGVILYQFLTGERPFTGNATITMRKVLEEDPLPPSRFNVQIPGAMDAVVRKALAKKPDERFQSAEEFAAALDAAAHADREHSGETTLAPPAKRPATSAAGSVLASGAGGAKNIAGSQATAGAAPKSQRAALAVVAAVVVVAIGVAVWFVTQRRADTPDNTVQAKVTPPSGGATTIPPPLPAWVQVPVRRRRGPCGAPRRGATKDRSRRAGDFGGRPRRSERGALPERQGADAERPARGFAQPARREGGRAAGRHGLGRKELRSAQRQAPVAERRIRDDRRARKRAANGQGWTRVADDRGHRERERRAEVAQRDVAQRADRVHSRQRRPARRGAHRDPRRRRARCAGAAVARGGKHPEGAHQVVRLPHVVGERREAPSPARTSSSRAKRKSSGFP